MKEWSAVGPFLAEASLGALPAASIPAAATAAPAECRMARLCMRLSRLASSSSGRVERCRRRRSITREVKTANLPLPLAGEGFDRADLCGRRAIERRLHRGAALFDHPADDVGKLGRQQIG